jgi:hypothetical protein
MGSVLASDRRRRRVGGRQATPSHDWTKQRDKPDRLAGPFGMELKGETYRDLISLQGTAGNRAVRQLVTRALSTRTGATIPVSGVQLQGESERDEGDDPKIVHRYSKKLYEGASRLQTIIARFLAGSLVSRRSIVTWTGGAIAKARAARLAGRIQGYTLEMTVYGGLLDGLAAAGRKIPHTVWKAVSVWFAFIAGLRKQPMRSVMRVPVRTGAIREAEVKAHRVGKVSGTALRGGIRVSGGIGILSLGEDFESIKRKRTQVELEGLSPGDFDVDHEFNEVYLGEAMGGSVYVDIRVERNVIWRKKFYIVEWHIRA